MLKKIIYLLLLFISTVILSGCWGGEDDKQVSNNQAQTGENKNNNSNDVSEVVKKANIEVVPSEEEQYLKAMEVYNKCLSDYCKSEYENIRNNKTVMKYFNKLVSYNDSQKIINKSTTKTNEEITNEVLEKGIESIRDCSKVVGKDNGYENLTQCILNENLTKTKPSKLLNKYYDKYEYGIDFYRNLDNVCTFWKNYSFGTIDEIKKQIEEYNSKGFDKTNKLITTYNTMDRIFGISKKQYNDIINNVCKSEYRALDQGTGNNKQEQED